MNLHLVKIPLLLLLLNVFTSTGLWAQAVERYFEYPENLKMDDQITAALDERTNVKDIRIHEDKIYIVTKDRGVFTTTYSERQHLQAIKFKRFREKEMVRAIDFDDELWLIADNYQLCCLSANLRYRTFGTTYNKTHVLTDAAIYKDKFVSSMLQKGLKIQTIIDHGRIVNEYQPMLKNDALPSDDVRVLFMDSDSILWIGTDRGLSSFDGDTIVNHAPIVREGKMSAFLRKVKLKKTAATSSPIEFPFTVTAITEYHEDLVVGGPGGLWRISKQGHEITAVEAIPIPRELNLINDLLVDHNRMLWIAGNMLLKYNLYDQTFTNFNALVDGKYRSKRAFCLAEDLQHDKMWVGTSGSGVYIIDNDEKPIDRFRQTPVVNQVSTWKRPKINRKMQEKEAPVLVEAPRRIEVKNKQGETKTYFRDSLMTMSDVNFTVDSDLLTSTAKRYLKTLSKDLIQIVRTYREVQITINGHTSKDQRGESQANQKLSDRRAEQVKNFLIKEGVQPSKFIINGFGDQQPLAGFLTQPDHEAHRRVEIELSFSGSVR